MSKSLEFSVAMIEYCDYLNKNQRYIISNQLLKSSTSIGANVYEAQHAESRLDFLHKMKVALKEANESFYWLTLCGRIKNLIVEQKNLDSINEIIAILPKIIITTRKNLK